MTSLLNQNNIGAGEPQKNPTPQQEKLWQRIENNIGSTTSDHVTRFFVLPGMIRYYLASRQLSEKIISLVNEHGFPQAEAIPFVAQKIAELFIYRDEKTPPSVARDIATQFNLPQEKTSTLTARLKVLFDDGIALNV